MTSIQNEFLDNWHRIVQEKDIAALGEILAEDVSMGAPPYWDRLEGHTLVHKLLELIINTIADFTYHREWLSDSKNLGEIALEFKGYIGELDLQGIDLITLNEQGKIQQLDVMIRPINALEALRDEVGPKMMAFLTGSENQ